MLVGLFKLYTACSMTRVANVSTKDYVQEKKKRIGNRNVFGYRFADFFYLSQRRLLVLGVRKVHVFSQMSDSTFYVIRSPVLLYGNGKRL